MPNTPRTPIAARLDNKSEFGKLQGTRYYEDAVYEKFSDHEMNRRYTAVRKKMTRLGVEALIVGGGPSHWSFGGGMRWLTNHWEWHAMAVYVLAPLEGEPTLVYSMGGSHIEAVRRAVTIKDVRPSRGGRFAEVLVERIKELGLEKSSIGLTMCDPRFKDNLPINQYQALREGLPEADLQFVGDFFHELWLHKSPEELECVRKAGEMADIAMQALVERAAPGVTEYQLAAAATGAVMDAGGQVNFLIIGSSPMSNPALIFGNPAPSSRKLQPGDLINNELALGYRGYTTQIGTPICIGEPTAEVRNMYDEIALPGYRRLEALLRPDVSFEEFRQAAQWFGEQGFQSRPTVLHGIDIVTGPPHIWVEEVAAGPNETHFEPNSIIMLEPNPITPDGNLGLFLGRTYIITEAGAEQVTKYPLELVVKQ
ncbi:MAG TPA: Xaa-Pro peptidase family protein [Anaerolineae bacterium]